MKTACSRSRRHTSAVDRSKLQAEETKALKDMSTRRPPSEPSTLPTQGFAEALNL